MSDDENQFDDGRHLSENEGDSDQELADLASLQDEQEKLSNKENDEDLGEINYDKESSKQQDDNGGMGSEGEEKIKKKENKKMGKIRKKVKKDGEPDGENKDFGVSDNESADETERKAAKKGKKLSNKLDEEVVARECEGLLQAMEEAYDRDRLSNKQKKLALEKVKLINTLTASLKKPQIQERFLNSNGLDMISKWLEKMPDGSPPGQTLKKKLIDIVNIMPVDGEHVSNTTLSKRLYEFYKNPKEDADLKKTLKIIIDKFSRVALSMLVDYSNQNEEASFSRRKDNGYSLDENTRQEKIKNLFYNPLKPYERRTLNTRVGYNFTVAPKSINDKDIKSKRSNAGPDFEKVYSDYKRRKKLK